MLRSTTRSLNSSSSASVISAKIVNNCFIRRSATTTAAVASQISGNFISSSNNQQLQQQHPLVFRGFHSLALEQAMRITSPSAKHPATETLASSEGKGGKTINEESNPANVWREHWDVEFERPYYHNLVTNEVRTTLPEGFPTRFLFYYQKHKGGVVHEPSDAHKVPQHATRAKSMKERIKDYGMAGLLLYGVIHFGMLGIIFGTMVAGVDVQGAMRRIGIDVGASLRSKDGKPSMWKLWLLAVVINKVFAPLQVLATISLAPRVAPLLKAGLQRVGLRA